MATFGELLSELRKDRNMTQKDLAKIIYVTPGTISNYENNTHLPDVEKLICLADYFGVTTDYLLGRCSANLSPDVFDEIVLGRLTASQLIEQIQALTSDRRQALVTILDNMKMGMMVELCAAKEKK